MHLSLPIHRQRNLDTIEFLGISESVHDPGFDSGDFATIESHVGLNSYRLRLKDWVDHMGLPSGERLTKLNVIAIRQMRTLTASAARLLEGRDRA